MQKQKKLIFSLLLAGTLTTAGSITPVQASEATGIAGEISISAGSTTTTGTTSTSSSTGESSSTSTSTVTNGLIFSNENSGANLLESSGLVASNVTADDIGQWAESKGQDVINIMKIIGRYFCLGGFIMSCLAMIAGLFGNKRALTAGFIGMILAGIMYGAIVMSDDIVVMIARWAAS